MIPTACVSMCRVLLAAAVIGADESPKVDAANNRRDSVHIDVDVGNPISFLRRIGFAADNRTLIAAVYTAKGGQIVFWDVATGKRIREFGTDGPCIDAARFTSNGTSVVTLTNEFDRAQEDAPNAFRFWDLETGQLRARIGRPPPDMVSFELTPDGQTIVTAAPNGLIRIVDIPTSNEISSAFLEEGARGFKTLALSPDGRMMAAAIRQRLYLWERLGNLDSARIETGRNISSLAFSPDGTILAEGAVKTGDIVLRNVRTQRVLRTLADAPKPPFGISSLVFSPDGRSIAAADGVGVPPESRRVLVWNVTDGEVLHRFVKEENQKRPQNARMAISGDGRWLAVGWDGSGIIDVWNISRDVKSEK